MSKLKAYIALSRPFTLLSPALGFISGGLAAWRMADDPSGAALAAGAAGSMLLNAFSNSLNQIYDLEIDRINQPKRPLPSGALSLREVWGFTIAALVIALAVAAAVKTELAAIFLAAAVITWAYSAPPLRAKARGMWGNFAICIPRGMLLFVSGWTAVASPWTHPDPWAAGAVLALFVFGAASTKDFSDVEGDRAFGVMTLPVRFGPAKAAAIIAPFLVVPFLLVPGFIAAGALQRSAMPCAALAAYGLFIGFLMIRENSPARKGKPSRASWMHMYLMLILAQLGFALCYFI